MDYFRTQLSRGRKPEWTVLKGSIIIIKTAANKEKCPDIRKKQLPITSLYKTSKRKKNKITSSKVIDTLYIRSCSKPQTMAVRPIAGALPMLDTAAPLEVELEAEPLELLEPEPFIVVGLATCASQW